jgi:hypothetical protein
VTSLRKRPKVPRCSNPGPFAAQSPLIMPVFQQQPPPSQRSKPNPTPKRVQGRQGHYAAAAAAAAVMFACSATVAAAHAAHHVAASYSSGTWSTAALSVARQYLAATSLPNVGVAIFAGGSSTFCDVTLFISVSLRVVFKNSCAGWVMGWLSGRGLVLVIACASLMPCAADLVASNAVDIFNVTCDAWSTANLSVARYYLAATSLPSVGVAIFAGGAGTCNDVYFRIVHVACCVVRVG